MTTEFTGTIGYLSPIGTLPDGLIVLPFVSADDDLVGRHAVRLQPLADRRVTTSVRGLPPNGGGADTPGRLANIGRTWNSAWSWISATLRVSLDSTR